MSAGGLTARSTRLASVAVALAIAGTAAGWAHLGRALATQPSPPRQGALAGVNACRPPLVALGEQVWALCSVPAGTGFARLDAGAGRARVDWSIPMGPHAALRGGGARLEPDEPDVLEVELAGLVPRDDGGAIAIVAQERRTYFALEPGGEARRLGDTDARVLGAAWSRARGLEVAEAERSGRIRIRALDSGGAGGDRVLVEVAPRPGLRPEAAFRADDGWQLLFAELVRHDDGREALVFHRMREGRALEALGERPARLHEVDADAIGDHSRGHVVLGLGQRSSHGLRIRWTDDGLEPLPEPPAGADAGFGADFVASSDGRGLAPLPSADRERRRFVGGRWLRHEVNDLGDHALAEGSSPVSGAVARWPLHASDARYVLLPSAAGGVLLLDDRGRWARVDRSLERVDPITASERVALRLAERAGGWHAGGAWRLRGVLGVLAGYPVLAGVALVVARLRRRSALAPLAIAALAWLALASLVGADFARFVAAC